MQARQQRQLRALEAQPASLGAALCLNLKSHGGAAAAGMGARSAVCAAVVDSWCAALRVSSSGCKRSRPTICSSSVAAAGSKVDAVRGRARCDDGVKQVVVLPGSTVSGKCAGLATASLNAVAQGVRVAQRVAQLGAQSIQRRSHATRLRGQLGRLARSLVQLRFQAASEGKKGAMQR